LAVACTETLRAVTLRFSLAVALSLNTPMESAAPKPTPLETFMETHPAARRFVESPKPAPRSFATETYYAVDAFRFTNARGESRYGRYRIEPVAGGQHIDAAEAARRPANFLFDELSERMARDAVEFRLIIQVAAEGDPIDDPTSAWPAGRERIDAGSLTVSRRAADSDASQRKLVFDPARLTDGIEPGDSLIEVRSAVYAISARRREG
jgi:catalase